VADSSTRERRERPRDDHETRATGVIQTIIRDPFDAVAVLLGELNGGAPPGVITTLLDNAEAFARLRGADIGPEIILIRRRLHEGGYSV
jgi:hypothetical protein